MENKEQNNFTIQEQPSIDIKKYLFKGLSYWYLFLLTVPAAYYYAQYQNKFIVPRYAVNIKILTKAGGNEAIIAGGMRIAGSNSNAITAKGILKSYSLNKKVIEKLDFEYSYFEKPELGSPRELYKRTPFIVNFDTTYSQTGALALIKFNSADEYRISIEADEFEKIVKTGEQFTYKNYSFNIKLKNPNVKNPAFFERVFYFRKNSLSSLINSYAARVNAENYLASSSILWIWITGTVPQKESDYLNKLVEVYIAQNLDEKNQKLIRIIDFIDRQLDEVTDSLAYTENKLLAYKQQSKLVSISQKASLISSKYNNIKEEIRNLKLKINYFNYIRSDFEENTDINSIMSPEIVGIADATLSGLLNKLTGKILERESFNAYTKKNIPITKTIELEAESIKRQILNHVNKTINISKETITKLNQELIELDKEIYKLPISEQKLLKIEKKFSINQGTYDFLVKKRMEAEISQASNQSDLKLLDISRPENASRESTGKSKNTQRALMIGFIIPIIIIVLIELLNNKIEDKQEIERATKMSVIATIGRNDKDTQLPTVDNPKTSISESFRALRTNLKYILDKDKHSIISITSSVSGEGKSFISQNIASIIAISQKKTLLIGLDLRKPKLQEVFEHDNSIGASTFLSNNNTINEVIIKTRVPNLDVILSGTEPPNPSELIESQKMKELLDYAKKEYDYVIIDTPPVGIVTDGLVVAKYSDAFLYVVRHKYTTKEAFKIINELKGRKEIKNMSLIFNDIHYKRKHGKYGYGYYSHYFEDDDKNNNLLNKIKKRFQKIA